MSFATNSGVLGANVAQNGTFTIAYPGGRTGGDFQGGVFHYMTVNQRLYSAPADFTVAFGAALATITWKGANTLLAGSPFRVQFDLAGDVVEFPSITRAQRAYLERIDLGMPVASVANSLRVAAALATFTPTVIPLLAAGLIFDVPRNVIITSSGNDTGCTFLVTGKDEYGVTMSELITGANAGVAAGKKAFKSITTIVNSIAAAGTVAIGFGNVLGLPIFIPAIVSILVELQDGVGAGAGTKVAGLSPLLASTTITADVRGTYVPAVAPDGLKAYSLYAAVSYRDHKGNPQA